MYVNTHQALEPASADRVQMLLDRAEIVDAVYRFGLGQDRRYEPWARDLFRSAFTEDAELDFRPAAAKCGLEVPLMVGRETITSIILDPRTRIDTTHVVTNPRVTIDGDDARLTAIVEAQHLPSADHSRHALLKNLYDVDLVRDGSRWLISRMHIDCVWFTGEPAVITGG